LLGKVFPAAALGARINWF
jgi:hypothetical protein